MKSQKTPWSYFHIHVFHNSIGQQVTYVQRAKNVEDARKRASQSIRPEEITSIEFWYSEK